MNHSLYQDGILKALPFKRLPCLVPQPAQVWKPAAYIPKILRFHMVV